MKKIISAALGLALLSGFSVGCKMETELYNNIEVSKSTSSISDINNILNGAMNQFAGYRFYGRNYVAIGDMAADVASASPSSGHFVAINSWTFSSTSDELDDLYSSGSVVIDACTRGIIGAKALMEKATEEADKKKLEELLSQFYGLKAYTYFCMSNVFAKAYSPEHATGLGLVLVKDELIAPKTQITRATLQETYDYILELLTKAQSCQSEVTSPFFVNPVNLKAFEAKVRLYMRDYAGASKAIKEVLKVHGGAKFDKTGYLNYWSSTAPTSEDIFTLIKAENDNLSANSINTLYGSYGGALTDVVSNLIGENDYRSELIGDKLHPKKYDGTPTSDAVSNVRVIRLSEAYLIEAECQAQLGNIVEAQEALFYTAQRNADITDATQLPADKDALLKFIAEERVRELFQEGNRFYDLRRTEATAKIADVDDYKPYNFCYPIPESEINAGFMTQQNSDWKNNMPMK